MASMRRVQQSNQSWLSSGSSATPAGAAQAMRRRRSSSASCAGRLAAPPGARPGRRRRTRRRPGSNAPASRSGAAIAAAASPSLRPEAKAAAPQARSWPANSLPCMKLNIATSSARDLRVGRAVGGFEHHREQAGDQLDEGGGRLRPASISSAPMRRRSAGQGVQPGQHPGDAAEQARAVADAGWRRHRAASKASAHGLLQPQAFGDLFARAARRSAGLARPAARSRCRVRAAAHEPAGRWSRPVRWCGRAAPARRSRSAARRSGRSSPDFMEGTATLQCNIRAAVGRGAHRDAINAGRVRAGI